VATIGAGRVTIAGDRRHCALTFEPVITGDRWRRPAFERASATRVGLRLGGGAGRARVHPALEAIEQRGEALEEVGDHPHHLGVDRMRGQLAAAQRMTEHVVIDDRWCGSAPCSG
jgi:hypothetical protein